MIQGASMGLARAGEAAWSDGSTRVELSAESTGARLGLRLRRPVAPWREDRCAIAIRAPGAVLAFEGAGTR